MTPSETVTAFIEAIERMDIDAAAAMLADDVSYENVPMDPIVGREGVRVALGRFLGAATEVSWPVSSQFTDGNRVANERIDRFKIGNGWLEMPVAGFFEVNNDGEITLWRDGRAHGMTSNRTRSEYRFSIAPGQFEALGAVENLHERDRDVLAQLMLDAYRGTIDDEGETMVEAGEAIDTLLRLCLREHSFVLKEDGVPIAISFVLTVDDIHYIDPVAVTASHKRTGLGRKIVETSLASIAATGVTEMGATITDGNTPSERLFARLGATRVGPWPPHSG